jgi:hypothetical protein
VSQIISFYAITKEMEGHECSIGIPVENPISRKFRSGVSGQTFEVQTNENITEQKEAASAPTYASILKKGVKWAPVTVHSF